MSNGIQDPRFAAKVVLGLWCLIAFAIYLWAGFLDGGYQWGSRIPYLMGFFATFTGPFWITAAILYGAGHLAQAWKDSSRADGEPAVESDGQSSRNGAPSSEAE